VLGLAISLGLAALLGFTASVLLQRAHRRHAAAEAVQPAETASAEQALAAP
jgi:hypothetical protein